MAEQFGPAGEWKKLDGSCISKALGEYSYELCWFGEAKQKSTKGGATNSLGCAPHPPAPASSLLATPRLTPGLFSARNAASSSGGTRTARPRRAPSSTTRRSCTTTAPSAGTGRTGASRCASGPSLRAVPLAPADQRPPAAAAAFQLELSCAKENELLSVVEAEKCEYVFKATSPALCWPAASEAEAVQVKQEL